MNPLFQTPNTAQPQVAGPPLHMTPGGVELPQRHPIGQDQGAASSPGQQVEQVGEVAKRQA